MDPERLRRILAGEVASGGRRRAGQRRRAAAPGVRRRVRPGRRDGPRRGHEGHRPGCRSTTQASPPVDLRTLCCRFHHCLWHYSAGPRGRRRAARPGRPRPTCSRADPRIGEVATARDGAAALRLLDRAIAEGGRSTPSSSTSGCAGLDGVVLGRLLSRFANPPRVVFVTAYEEHAVDAFEIKAEDYLLKPVRPGAAGRGDQPGVRSRPSVPVRARPRPTPSRSSSAA